MAFHPSVHPPQTSPSDHFMLRWSGVVLSLLSIALALGAMVFSLLSGGGFGLLFFSLLVGLFGTRMLVLWMGTPIPGRDESGTLSGGQVTYAPPVRPHPGRDESWTPSGGWCAYAPHSWEERRQATLSPGRPSIPRTVSTIDRRPVQGKGNRGGDSPRVQATPGAAGWGRTTIDENSDSRYAVGYASPSPAAYAMTSSAVPQPLYSQPSVQPAPAGQPGTANYYVQNGSPALYGWQPTQQQAALPPYVPIEQDALFQFDPPVPGVQCFILTKEGELMVECQDRYALNAQQRCFAVADGVAGSFVPGLWARIICKNFVERGGEFASEDAFKNWLGACTQEWHEWIERRWVPTMNALRERSGERPGDWGNDILQGAQTTLIGCRIVPGSPLRKTAASARVFAIGDAQFFLFRPHPQNGWMMTSCFPYTSSQQFGSRPNTLMTILRPDVLDRTWAHKQMMSVNVWPGDRILLASDTLAQWLLRQIERNSGLWIPFLNINDTREFEQYMRLELHAGQIEDDVLTLLNITV